MMDIISYIEGAHALRVHRACTASSHLNNFLGKWSTFEALVNK